MMHTIETARTNNPQYNRINIEFIYGSIDLELRGQAEGHIPSKMSLINMTMPEAYLVFSNILKMENIYMYVDRVPQILPWEFSLSLAQIHGLECCTKSGLTSCDRVISSPNPSGLLSSLKHRQYSTPALRAARVHYTCSKDVSDDPLTKFTLQQAGPRDLQ